MALTDTRAAFVNLSSSIIPVYDRRVSSQIHIGSQTVGGTQIGSIYPNEFYTVIPNGNYMTSWQIRFRRSTGAMATGYIESSPGTTLGDYAWKASQQGYHGYNSNSSGTGLVASTIVTIGGISYRRFTISRALRCIDTSGGSAKTLAASTKLATNTSTTGVNNPGYMIFYKMQLPGATTWTDIYPSLTNKYGFVNLGLEYGSEPGSRPIK